MASGQTSLARRFKLTPDQWELVRTRADIDWRTWQRVEQGLLVRAGTLRKVLDAISELGFQPADTTGFLVQVYARYQRRVLLLRSKKQPQWLPVSGELRPKETSFAAAQREFLVQTGLRGAWATQPPYVHGSPLGFVAYLECEGAKIFSFVAEVQTDHVQGSVEHRWVTTVQGLPCPPHVRELVQRCIGGF